MTLNEFEDILEDTFSLFCDTGSYKDKLCDTKLQDKYFQKKLNHLTNNFMLDFDHKIEAERDKLIYNRIYLSDESNYNLKKESKYTNHFNEIISSFKSNNLSFHRGYPSFRIYQYRRVYLFDLSCFINQ